MTLETLAIREQFEGNGTTGPFSFEIQFFANTDILVSRNSVAGINSVLVEGVDYTLAGARSAEGGTVNLTEALAVGEILIIDRELPFEQLTAFRNQGAFFPEIHEDAIDRNIMLLQQINNRALMFPLRHAVPGPIPFPALAASKFLRTNPAGTGLEFVASSLADIVGVLDDVIPSSQQAAFPVPGTAGRLRRMTDYTRGLWLDDGTRWIKQGGFTVNVLDFGADPTGAVSSSAVFNAAIAVLVARGGGTLYIPEGSYSIDDPILVNGFGIHVRGDGVFATLINYLPTVSGEPCFLFKMADDTKVLSYTSIRDLMILRGDKTSAKQHVGIELYDVSHFAADRVFIALPVDDSIALKTRGRELCDFNFCSFVATVPINHKRQLNGGAMPVSGDHFTFQNCFQNCVDRDWVGLETAGHPLIKVDDDVILQRYEWAGRNNFNAGSTLFEWLGGVAGTGGATSSLLEFDGIFWEQHTDVDGWAFNVDHYIHSLHIGQTSLGTCNGFKFRNVYDLLLMGSNYIGAAGRTAIDVDDTVHKMTLVGASWDQASTYTTTGMHEVYGSGFEGQNFPANALFESDDLPLIERRGGNVYRMSYKFTALADDGSFEIPFMDTVVPLSAKISVVAVKADTTEVEGGEVIYSASKIAQLSGSTAFETKNGGAATDGKLAILYTSAMVVTVENRLGFAVTGVVTVEGVQA